MKICCTSGECYDTFTEIQCMGCYSTDHCTGPVEVEDDGVISPEDMRMKYNIDNCKVFLGDKEITGYASGDFVTYPKKRLWYKDIEGKPFNVYATCDDGHTFEISFTEDDYEKWITPMEPTEKSPFKIKVN